MNLILLCAIFSSHKLSVNGSGGFESINTTTDSVLSHNDRFGYNRKLLQTQNISCNSEHTEPNTCIIYASRSDNGDIECNHSYPNCEINLDRYHNAIIYCPQNDCHSCIITCIDTCSALTIRGYDCQLVSVNATAFVPFDDFGIDSGTIYAPGNGGTLQITGTMWESEIRSSPGTLDIIITVDGVANNNDNLFNGEHITGNLNFSCIEGASCYNNHIICPSNSTKCNINCSSSSNDFVFRDCNDMVVYAKRGTIDVNWHCDNSKSVACFNAILECGNISSPNNSKLQYDVVNGWYFTTDDCVSNWSTPLVACAFTSDDTCYINKGIMESSRVIQCFDDLIHCVVELGDDQSTQTWPYNLQSIIHCPSSSECVSCRILCISDAACHGITIWGHNCSLLEVNIRANDQNNVILHAPRNGGDLVLLSKTEGRPKISFEHGEIYSYSGTRNIIIDFKNAATDNYIDGEYVSDYLNITCNNANCDDNEIICPNDANCNIDCRRSVYCQRLDVYAVEGIYDVNWLCDNDDPNSCRNSYLHCDDNLANEWYYGEFEDPFYGEYSCIDMPTEDPTPSPTLPSVSPTAAPSTSPSVAPSLSPSPAPTAPSAAPTMVPTKAPIKEGFVNKKEFSVIGGGSLLIFILSFVGTIYYYKYYKIEKKSLWITNAVVIVIGIGEYDDIDDIDPKADIDAHLNELDGIDHDIKNMVDLFDNELNYDVFPSHYLDDIKNGYSPKRHWAEKELNDFLVDRAIYLEQNIEKYDGLIVVISCHGIPGYICTSDYMKFKKLAIHRIFSSPHPLSRQIPRLFLFDCCSGNNEQETRSEDEEEEEKEDDRGKTIMSKDLSKNISMNNVYGDGDVSQPWVRGEYNPDYRLGVIEAANPGFQSKIRNDIGSYVIHGFYSKQMDILQKNKRIFIHKIFDQVQDELHKMGKQHPTYTWNDNTRYIRFKRNNALNKSLTKIEMTVTNSGGI